MSRTSLQALPMNDKVLIVKATEGDSGTVSSFPVHALSKEEALTMIGQIKSSMEVLFQD